MPLRIGDIGTIRCRHSVVLYVCFAKKKSHTLPHIHTRAHIHTYGHPVGWTRNIFHSGAISPSHFLLLLLLHLHVSNCCLFCCCCCFAFFFFSPLALFMVSLLHNTNKREQQIEKPFGPQSLGKYFCWRMIDARRCSRSKKHCPENRVREKKRENANCTSVECQPPVDG